jgi:hypothetical protein
MEVLSPEVKRPRSEAGHLHPTGTGVKETSIYIYTPPYVFMMYCSWLSKGTILPFILALVVL